MVDEGTKKGEKRRKEKEKRTWNGEKERATEKKRTV